MEGITDTYYMHGKRVCQDLEKKYLGEYHGYYLKSDTLLSKVRTTNRHWYAINDSKRN